jgi:hypothetical protein
LRINAQLIDAETDAYPWTERSTATRPIRSSWQDEVSSRIAIALK